MGKLKKNSRSSRIRRQQQQLGKGNGKADTHDDSVRTNKVIPLIQKLSSASPNDRFMAISAISVLCEDEKFRKTLLKEKLINIIMEQSLNDENDEIVVESYGLLRNLVIEEGYDVARFLLRSKIMISLEANISKASKSFDFLARGQAKEDEKQVLFDYAENLVGLVTGLATVDQSIFEEVYPSIDFAIKFVSDVLNWILQNATLRVSSRLFNALLDFVYQLSNQSSDFISNISKLIPASRLITFGQEAKLEALSKMYIAAVRFHFSEVEGINNRDEFVFQELQSIVSIISPINIKTSLEILAKPEDNNGKLMKDETKLKLSARNDLESIDIALDLIATLIEFNASEESQPENKLVQYYIDTIVPALIQLLSFKDQSFLNKSLVCLSNLGWLFFDLEVKPVEWFESLSQIWNVTFSDFIQLQKSSDVESMTDYLKVLWVVSKSLSQSLQGQIALEQIQTIVEKSNSVHEYLEDVELIKAYFVALIEFLSSIASIQTQTEITKAIGDHFLHLIKSSIDIINNDDASEDVKSLKQSYLFQLIIIEAISSIFDIFGDKNYDYDNAVYVQGNYTSELIYIEQKMKPIYKKIDKNRDAALKSNAEQVLSTLHRFIKYKQNE